MTQKNNYKSQIIDLGIVHASSHGLLLSDVKNIHSQRKKEEYHQQFQATKTTEVLNGEMKRFYLGKKGTEWNQITQGEIWKTGSEERDILVDLPKKIFSISSLLKEGLAVKIENTVKNLFSFNGIKTGLDKLAKNRLGIPFEDGKEGRGLLIVPPADEGYYHVFAEEIKFPRKPPFLKKIWLEFVSDEYLDFINSNSGKMLASHMMDGSICYTYWKKNGNGVMIIQDGNEYQVKKKKYASLMDAIKSIE